MYKIVVTMLDFPSVNLNDKEIIFPYKKLEALFYYLCVKKKITRDEATYLFWSEHSDSNAKKNLRDALYNLKKLFGFDIILTIKNKYITLNDEYSIYIDLDEFLKTKDVATYKKDFLDNFYIKNCYEFDNWYEETREYLKLEYKSIISSKVEEAFQIKDADKLEYYGKIIVKNNPYDEGFYRDLMNKFSELNSYNTAIKLYSELCENLSSDLKLSPEKETQVVFENILQKIEKANLKSNSLYYSSFENKETYPDIDNRKISLKSQAVIKNRILKLTSKEKIITDFISLFPQKCSLEEIKYFCAISEPELFSYLENLISKLIIKEFTKGSLIYYSFTSEKVKRIVYESQSIAKRRYFHKLIAEYYEQLYLVNPNIELCSNIIYQYENAYIIPKIYSYKLDYLNEICKTQHEIYPLIYFESTVHQNKQLSVDEKYILEFFEEIKSISAEFDDEYKLKEVYMKFYYIIGRYYISKGIYTEGLEYINKCISIAENIYDYDYLFASYIQLIFHSIQTDNISNMKYYINASFNYLKKSYSREKLAIILRLKGLYLYKTSDFTKSEKLLKKSIDILKEISTSKPYYNIAIAASLNYLGKIAISTHNYNSAFEYFEEGISLCKNEYSLNALGMFYANSAKLLYDTQNYSKAKEYIYLSIECFEKNNFLWGRGFAEAYASIIEEALQNRSSAFAHYHISKKINQSFSHPEALVLLEELDKVFLNPDEV